MVPPRRFLSITYHPKATRTCISFKGIILRLRQEKYGNHLAVFRCYDLSNCNYTIITFMYFENIFSCRSSKRISKLHISSENYENVDFV